MRKLLLKLALLSLPILIIVCFFVIVDPFQVIYNYKDYSKNIIAANTDYVDSKIYIETKDKCKYNSFVIGSSRAFFYNLDSWKQHLSDSAIPFAFYSARESIFGINTKLKYFDKTNTSIDNCLLIICTDHTFAEDNDSKGHLCIKHPTIAGTSWINFYLTFLIDFFDYNLLKNYILYSVTHKWDPSMEGYIVLKHNFDEEKIKQIRQKQNKLEKGNTTNHQNKKVKKEEEIKKQAAANYYIFYKRDSIIPPAKSQISQKKIDMLKEIKAIFVKHHTNYRIAISPLYNQIELNRKDLKILQDIFGKDMVFNFSGKNRFTASADNYFETSHYRPFVADSIMKIIYKK